MRSFERAVAADADFIQAMFEEAKRVGRLTGTTDWDEFYPNREILDEDIERGDLWALREDGRILAVIALLNEEFEEGVDVRWADARACELARLCVDPGLQSRGIGAEMMRLVSEEAARQGYNATRHLASVYNPAALRLYRKLGYTELGPVHCYGRDYIAFERLL
jgi:ribosomal protein S18 acetylase RimI-like enzyme